MAKKPKLLELDQLIHFWSELKLILRDKVDSETGKGIIDLAEYASLKTTVEALKEGTYDDTVLRALITQANSDIEALKTAVANIPIKISDLTNDSGYQTSSDVDSKISAALVSAVTYKGTVTDWADLPTNATVGDMYNVQNNSDYNNAGDNVVWNGTEWDIQAGTIDFSNFITVDDLITNEEIDAILSS